MDQLVGAPWVPPASWVRETPDDYVDGQTIKIQLDGPEAGRACGLIQPAPGKARFMGGGINHGIGIPDVAVDGMRSFHTGPMDFIDDTGATVQIQCGSVALGGGHSSVVQAANTTEASDWLQRRGKHARLADDLALYGTVTPVESGPNRGALLFRGAAYPHVTRTEAMVINNTTMSGENWPDPQYGGRRVFLGAARVKNTSFPYDVPEPLAADLDHDENGPVIMMFDPDTTTAGCENPEPVRDQPHPTPPSGEPAPAVPVRAELDPEDAARVAALEDRINELENLVAGLLIDTADAPGTTTSDPPLDIDEIVKAVLEVLHELATT